MRSFEARICRLEGQRSPNGITNLLADRMDRAWRHLMEEEAERALLLPEEQLATLEADLEEQIVNNTAAAKEFEGRREPRAARLRQFFEKVAERQRDALDVLRRSV